MVILIVFLLSFLNILGFRSFWGPSYILVKQLAGWLCDRKTNWSNSLQTWWENDCVSSFTIDVSWHMYQHSPWNRPKFTLSLILVWTFDCKIQQLQMQWRFLFFNPKIFNFRKLVFRPIYFQLLTIPLVLRHLLQPPTRQQLVEEQVINDPLPYMVCTIGCVP